jgi:hypothetical protein
MSDLACPAKRTLCQTQIVKHGKRGKCAVAAVSADGLDGYKQADTT